MRSKLGNSKAARNKTGIYLVLIVKDYNYCNIVYVPFSTNDKIVFKMIKDFSPFSGETI